LQKQINEKLTKKEIEERIEFTVAEMGKVRKRIDDLKHILENQKNLKLHNDNLELELNRLRYA